MKYEPVIGLEVHVQAKTKSKMFCSCSADYFESPPNSHTCPVCLGLPGALPVPNEEAIKLCIKTSLALNCKINMDSKFDRKNYFYPDLPKGYQISQYDKPIGYEGSISFDLEDGPKTIRITRVHQEEDTAKSIHSTEKTFIDFNKSGVPLIEIVTEPDMSSVEEVSAFAKMLRQIIRYSNVSDANMEKGQMRFEINISLRPEGTTELPNYKVEVKNIGSISVLEKVIHSEIERQSALLDNGITPQQETRGLVDMKGETVSQRSKESEADYRYFPEPDIPLMHFSEEFIEEIRESIGELPLEKKNRYVEEYGLDDYSATVIVNDDSKYKLFELCTTQIKNQKILIEIAKTIIGDYSEISSQSAESKLEAKHLIQLAELVLDSTITRQVAKQVLEKAYTTGDLPKDIVEIENLASLSDKSELDEIVGRIIKANPNVVEDIKSNPNAVMFLVGQVMKETQGKADAQVVKSLIEEKL